MCPDWPGSGGGTETRADCPQSRRCFQHFGIYAVDAGHGAPALQTERARRDRRSFPRGLRTLVKYTDRDSARAAAAGASVAAFAALAPIARRSATGSLRAANTAVTAIAAIATVTPGGRGQRRADKFDAAVEGRESNARAATPAALAAFATTPAACAAAAATGRAATAAAALAGDAGLAVLAGFGSPTAVRQNPNFRRAQAARRRGSVRAGTATRARILALCLRSQGRRI